MKVCLLMAGDEEGGLEQHFVELANGLSKKVDIVVIAHTKYQDRFDSSIIFESVDLSKGRKNLLTLWQLVKIINKNSPEIVHAHANKATSMLATVRYFVSAKIMATLHSQKKNIGMFNKMNHVIGVSHAVLNNVTNPHQTVIYNGVGSEVISHQKKLTKIDFGLKSKRPLAITVGRLTKVKGMDVVIEAWKDINADLFIIGDGPEKNRLQQLVQKEGIETIKFLGHRSDVPSLITLADLVIIGSRREGFSYVCAESLLLNTPVISTDVPVANEVIPAEFISPIEQSQLLNKNIISALDNLPETNKKFQSAYKQAQAEFTFNHMINKVIDCYNDCLKLPD